MFAFTSPIAAFLFTVMIIVALRPVAIMIGLVDVPSDRKPHNGNVPLIGGISILIGYILAMLMFALISGHELWSTPRIATYIVASAFLVVVGAWDDLNGLRVYVKFAAQTVAALAMIFAGGVVLTNLGTLSLSDTPLELGLLAVPFTVFATLGVINAVNMSDGVDGLGGGLVFVSAIGLAIANIMQGGKIGYTMFTLTLAATIAGFLVFNLRIVSKKTAWVFLGDSGSTFLGFSLAWLAISMSQGDPAVISPAAMLWFVMVPIFDAVTIVVRRIVRGGSPFKADREHLHHVLLMAGFTVGQTVALMTTFAAAGVLVGLGGVYFAVPDFLLAGLFTVTGLLYLWASLRAWKVMRFMGRSICRRSGIADRRTSSSLHTGLDPRSGLERRQHRQRHSTDPVEGGPARSDERSAEPIA